MLGLHVRLSEANYTTEISFVVLTNTIKTQMIYTTEISLMIPTNGTTQGNQKHNLIFKEDHNFMSAYKLELSVIMRSRVNFHRCWFTFFTLTKFQINMQENKTFSVQNCVNTHYYLNKVL